MNLHPKEDMSAISRDAILKQLAEVLSSKLFQGSERSTRLLRFLTEQTLTGQQSRLKEYTLGTKVLGKSPSFDPRLDPIVRTEISRLRSRLEKYYATEGRAAPLVIVLPKGSYVPRFESRIETGEPRAPSDRAKISIAVLPLANLSSDAGQEFFSDGMTDEIASALAKVPHLRVVARSSAYAFKNQAKQAPAIGQALGATHLIEGSVRQDGNRVRIAAQLIEAVSGMQLWSETYDRKLTDVFAIQENIATSIASALMLPLGLAQGDRLVSNRTSDLHTYQSYLRGRALIRDRRPKDAIAVLKQAVARDQNYAPAWAMLSQAYRVVLDYDPVTRGGPVDDARRFVEINLDWAEAAARKAIQLDPSHAGGYAALAYVQTTRGKWLEADDLFRKALALDPNDPEALFRHSQHLIFVGHTGQALQNFRELHSLEPFVPIYNVIGANVLHIGGKHQEGLKLLESVPENTPVRFYRGTYLAWAYAAAGRFSEAADALVAIPNEPQLGSEAIEVAARLLGAPERIRPERLPMFPCELSFVYAYLGALDRIMEFPEREPQIGARLTAWHWSVEFPALRKTERFKAFVRRTGLIDYWRARGWPELCRPLGENDFECD
jgi:TolB-like protein